MIMRYTVKKCKCQTMQMSNNAHVLSQKMQMSNNAHVPIQSNANVKQCTMS